MNKFAALCVVTILSLAGCVSNHNAIVSADIDETPDRLSVSSYRVSVSSENIDESNAAFYAAGIVTRIGEEQWYTVTDSVTGTETAAIYYRDVTIQVEQSTGPIGEKFILMVGSDFSPSIDLSRVGLGDHLVVAGYEGDARNGVTNHGADYVGLIDLQKSVVHSLYVGDQAVIPLDTVFSAYGLN